MKKQRKFIRIKIRKINLYGSKIKKNTKFLVTKTYSRQLKMKPSIHKKNAISNHIFVLLLIIKALSNYYY